MSDSKLGKEVNQACEQFLRGRGMPTRRFGAWWKDVMAEKEAEKNELKKRSAKSPHREQ